MGLFPAADEEQREFIKRVINGCDYYLFIIGGSYGTTIHDGLSYTDKEYNYAFKRGLKIIAFVHENPELIALGMSDADPELRARLHPFREKVAANRLVKSWTKAEDLRG